MDKNDVINFKLLEKIIVDGDVLVDIGANHGIYTELFSNLSKNGKVYSVELHPGNCSILNERFKNRGNVIIKNKAISDVNGVIDFYSGNGHCTHNIIGKTVKGLSKKSGEIESITVDELLKNEDRIKLIKMDIEGAELMALKGMENTVGKVDYMLIECHLDEDWVEIRDLLLNKYNMYCENNTGIVIDNETSRYYQCFCKNNNLK